MDTLGRHQYWTGILLEQSSSGLTKKDFCAARSINCATFYYWQRRLEPATDPLLTGFHELTPVVDHELSVCLPNGEIVLRSSSPQTLAQVIKALIDV